MTAPVVESPPNLTQAAIARLVVPVDLSHQSWQALPLARALAQRLSVPLVPLHVDTTATGPNAPSDHPLELRVSVGGEPAVVQVLPATDVVLAIEKAGREVPGSVVVMSTHGHGLMGGLVIGSVCEELLRVHDAPVVAVGPGFDPERHSEIARVVVCVDATAPSNPIVSDAVAWAEILAVPMVVATVRGRGRSRAGEDETYHVLDAIFEDLPPTRVPVTADVLDDLDSASSIVDYAGRRPGTLLAFAPGAGHRAVHALTHRVSMQVVRESRVPMLLRWYRDDGKPSS